VNLAAAVSVCQKTSWCSTTVCPVCAESYGAQRIEALLVTEPARTSTSTSEPYDGILLSLDVDDLGEIESLRTEVASIERLECFGLPLLLVRMTSSSTLSLFQPFRAPSEISCSLE